MLGWTGLERLLIMGVGDRELRDGYRFECKA